MNKLIIVFVVGGFLIFFYKRAVSPPQENVRETNVHHIVTKAPDDVAEKK